MLWRAAMFSSGDLSMLRYPANDSVRNVAECDLRAGDGVWNYAIENAAAIDAGWQQARATRPSYFNGTVYLTERFEIAGNRARARLLKSDFKSYLHWRLAGYPETGVCDGFGSALLKSCDGAVLLGRQRAGNVNEGLAYLPGGFIDSRDVADDGAIDIAASIARELCEETGLTLAELDREEAFFVTQSKAQLSIAITFTSRLDAAALQARIAHHIAADGQSELAEAVIVRSSADLEGLAMPLYTKVLLSSLLPTALSGERPA